MSSKGYDNPAYHRENGDVAVSLDEPVTKLRSGEGITYSWNKVNVFAAPAQSCGRKKAAEEKHILKDVTGICRPGELLAIMGASGAGKTTLLNVLTYRSDLTLRVTGGLYVNGKKVSPDLLTSRSAYVQQEDLFIGTFTVREQLIFQANLRMDRGLSQQQRIDRVEEVMQELSLTKCAKTLIGIPGRLKGISGGETKRLAFACEILTNPPLMFLDEPTSGLDSFMAQSVVQAMKTLADKGKTIISTIHQPSSEVFALFDRVLLMGEGQVAYLGSTSGALSFFSGMGHSCPKTYNPADFFISTLAVEPDREEECRQFVNDTCEAFASGSEGQALGRAVHTNMQAITHANGDPSSRDSKLSKSAYKVGSGRQLGAVLKRSMLANIREPVVLWSKIFQAVVVSLLLGVIYLNQEMDQKGVTNIKGAIFLYLTQLSFSNCFSVVNAFCMELPIFLREHFNGMYRTDVYFISKNLAELPFTIIIPFIFTGISYYMIGLYSPAKNFFICCAIVILVANAAVSFGFMISCLAKDINVALALSAPLLIPLMLFGGMFINASSIPVYFIWIRYISWFNYGYEALTINQWKDVEEIACPSQQNNSLCLSSGLDVIESLSFNPNHLSFDIGLLFTIIVAFRLIGYLLLLLKTRRKAVKQID